MKTLIILALTIFSTNAFSATLSQNQKPDCISINNSPNSKPKVVIPVASDEIEVDATKTSGK